MEQTIRRVQSPYRTGNKKMQITAGLFKYWSKFIVQTIISAIILVSLLYCRNTNVIATSAFWERTTNILEQDVSVEDMKKGIIWGIEQVKSAISEPLEEEKVSKEVINDSENIDKKEEVVINDVSKDMTQEEKDIYDIKRVMTVLRPVKGEITSKFGDRNNPITDKAEIHTGTDYAVAVGTQIKSAISGTVIEVKKSNVSLGNFVRIKNSDIVTTYGHCSTIKVKEGDKVKQGDIIALSGNTGKSSGPHLHFEVKKANRYIDPEKLTG